MRCSSVEEPANGGEELRCPICRDARPTESALRYHLRQNHRKKRSEIESLVELGKEELDKKKPRLESPTIDSETEIKAPIIPSSLTEDDSHFLLSRTLPKSDSGAGPSEDSTTQATSSEVDKNFVCQCGQRFETSMSLSVHCALVSHKFTEHYNSSQHRKEHRKPSFSTSDRKRILTQTQPIYCYACPRASKHQDLTEFTDHVVEKHLTINRKEKKSGNPMSESDLRRALLRFPPTMMEPVGKFCRQCSKELKKMNDFRAHILSHTDIPKFRCRFCVEKKFTAQRREEMFHHIRNKHERVLTNAETEKGILESCRVDPKLLWLAYGIDFN